MKTWLKLKIIIFLLVLGFVFSSCSIDYMNATEFIFIKINDYGVNDEFELSADNLIIGNELDKTEIFFSSSDESVVKVVDGNRFKCIGVGQAEIYATIINKYNNQPYTTSTILNVTEAAICLNSFSVNNDSVVIEKGKSICITELVECCPENYVNPVTINIKDENVILIESQKIIGVAEGRTTITFSVVDYFTGEEISEVVNIEVVDASVLKVDNLIDNKMIFLAQSSGQIAHSFSSSYVADYYFSTTNNDLIDVYLKDKFTVKDKAGDGTIKLHYQLITGEKAVIAYDFKVIKPPSASLENKEVYFTNTEYEITIKNTNSDNGNFILSDNVTVLSVENNEHSTVLKVHFHNKEDGEFIVLYKNNYSYTCSDVLILEKQIPLYNQDDIKVNFSFNEQTIKKEHETITLYLLNESGENIAHEYYADVNVSVDDVSISSYQVCVNNDNLLYENNKIKTNKVQGDSTVDIIVNNSYIFQQNFTVKKLLVTNVEVECSTDTIYLHSPDEYFATFDIKLDCDYAYNANDIKVANLSPEDIKINGNKIEVIAINNANNNAKFKVTCGSNDEAISIEKSIKLEYYITRIEISLTDGTGKEINIENQTVQLSMVGSVGLDIAFVSLSFHSGNILVNKEISCKVNNTDIIVSEHDEIFMEFHMLQIKNTGEADIYYSLTGDSKGKTTYQLKICVI